MFGEFYWDVPDRWGQSKSLCSFLDPYCWAVESVTPPCHGGCPSLRLYTGSLRQDETGTWATDTMTFQDDELSYALGKQGGTRIAIGALSEKSFIVVSFEACIEPRLRCFLSKKHCLITPFASECTHQFSVVFVVCLTPVAFVKSTRLQKIHLPNFGET